MKLKNYTSGVRVEKSISEIESLLVKAGATAVSRFYVNGRLGGFLFEIPVRGIPMTFKLPSNPEAVERVMKEGVRKPHKGTMKRIGTLERIKEQAERTAWKLLNEWVHIQLSMISMQQAEAMQVFLPYIYDQKKDQTFFEKLKGTGFKQLAPAKEDPNA